MPTLTPISGYNSFVMILVTGGTGFIGNVLIRHLTDLGYPVKLLLRPSKSTPDLPKGIPLEVAVTSLSDTKGIRAAMKDVDIVYHLASAESLGREAQLSEVDIQGTQALINAASQARLQRFIYLSHLGADRASAYPLLKAKAIAEHTIRSSGIPHTIFRTAIAYGERDHFSNGLAFLLKMSPYFVMVPEYGSTLLQPIWVEDLARAMTWSLEMPITKNETIRLGGPEYLSFKEICEIIIRKLGIKRQLVNVKPLILNTLTEIIEILMPNFPSSVFWLDYLATNRTTDLDILARMYDLLPARMNQQLGYLENKNFSKYLFKIIFRRKRTLTRWD